MDEIRLDQKAFRTLASESRVGILKALAERRKTLSELAKELGMGVSTVSEHLDQLVAADLIRQIDDGHKWKYYELTRKGRGVLFPGETRVMIALALAALGFVGVLYDFLWRALSGAPGLAAAAAVREAVPLATEFPSAAGPLPAVPVAGGPFGAPLPALDLALPAEAAALIALGAILLFSLLRFRALRRTVLSAPAKKAG